MLKRICPRCGGTHTAKILWGLPLYDEELEKRIENEEVVLGGCCIPIPRADYHCFDCDCHILFDTTLDQRNTESISLFVHGFFNFPGHILHVYHEQDAYYMEGPELKQIKEITSEIFNKILKAVYSCCPGEWEREYIYPYVLDGTQWELEIDFKESYQYHDGRRTIKVQGDNAYPPLWTKMLRKITPFLGIKPSEF